MTASPATATTTPIMAPSVEVSFPEGWDFSVVDRNCKSSQTHKNKILLYLTPFLFSLIHLYGAASIQVGSRHRRTVHARDVEDSLLWAKTNYYANEGLNWTFKYTKYRTISDVPSKYFPTNTNSLISKLCNIFYLINCPLIPIRGEQWGCQLCVFRISFDLVLSGLDRKYQSSA